MNKAILDSDVQGFINKNLNTGISTIGLSKSPFPAISSKELAQQIDAKKRCEAKLPLWYSTPGIYFPEKLAIEQSSSEATALYKSRLVSGSTIIDLTGGFGVDSVFFAKNGATVTHCEINQELSVISSHNSHVLGVSIKYVQADGIAYLKSSEERYDTIYIDPSRRISSRKVFMLSDCEPDVIAERELLLRKSNRLIIKTAPLLDIHSTIKELGAVSEVQVVSIKNDCKEVLYIVDHGSTELDPPITCASIGQHGLTTFTFRASAEKAFEIKDYSKPMTFLYEPDVSLLKAGCFKLITKEFGVSKLHQHTHLYTSDHLQQNFMGRHFRILETWDYGTFIKSRTVQQANIICRNFPKSPDRIRKKLRINDGGNDYLLFCTGPDNGLLVIHCDRLQ